MEKLIDVKKSANRHVRLFLKEFIIPNGENIYSIELWDKTFYYDDGDVLKKHIVVFNEAAARFQFSTIACKENLT